MKKALLVVCALVAVILWLCLRAGSPAPITTPAGAVAEASPTFAAIDSAATPDDVPPAPQASREPVAVPVEASAAAVLPPLQAFANYVLDMRATPAEKRASWFAAKGLVLEHAEFRATFGTRWGIPAERVFDAAEVAPQAVYSLWLTRAQEQNADLLGAVLALVFQADEHDLWQHWLWFLPCHRDRGDRSRICHELQRFIELLDAAAPDREARLHDALLMLAVLSSLDKELRADFLDLFAAHAIAGATADDGVFPVAMIAPLCATVPYAEIADRIQALLSSPSAKVRGGAVQMLRQYATLGQVNGEGLVHLLPDRLLTQEGGIGFAAAVELLANFGGRNGLERVLRLTREGDASRRGSALELLAATHRISTATVLGYTEPAMTRSVVTSLAMLGSRDPLAVTELQRFLLHEDAEVRRLAAGFLLQAGQLTAEAARGHGVGVADPGR